MEDLERMERAKDNKELTERSRENGQRKGEEKN